VPKSTIGLLHYCPIELLLREHAKVSNFVTSLLARVVKEARQMSVGVGEVGPCPVPQMLEASHQLLVLEAQDRTTSLLGYPGRDVPHKRFQRLSY